MDDNQMWSKQLRTIRQAQTVVEAHLKEVEDAWYRHFGR
jgi:hypothetical protein